MAAVNPVPNVGTPLTDSKGNTNQQWWTFWARLGAQALNAIVLKTNGVLNGSQSLLNLISGSGITLSDNGAGGVTITASQLSLMIETPAGPMDSANTAFALSHRVSNGWLLLLLNGVYQEPIVDFAIAGRQITFTVPPKADDSAIKALYARGGN